MGQRERRLMRARVMRCWTEGGMRTLPAAAGGAAQGLRILLALAGGGRLLPLLRCSARAGGRENGTNAGMLCEASGRDAPLRALCSAFIVCSWSVSTWEAPWKA